MAAVILPANVQETDPLEAVEAIIEHPTQSRNI